MEEIFIVGDIHGQLDMANKLLKKWKPDSQLLIFLGDYIDRGHNSYGVIQMARKLHLEYGAIPIGGNHEINFLNFLDNAEDEKFSKWKEKDLNTKYGVNDSTSIHYYTYGGDKTIDSFYNQPKKSFDDMPSIHANYIKNNFVEEIGFLKNLPFYYEWNDYVCVHAGVNLANLNWKDSTETEFKKIRTRFYDAKNNTGKKFIFGHHQTKLLNEDESNKIWISPCGTKICIDGGAVFGGLLHGLVIKEDSFLVHSVDNNGNLYKT
jgi:serine/threonine protein phosphatase 1